MARKTRLKTAAASAPQTRDQCAAEIRRIGDLQREHSRTLADLNDTIAAATAQAQPELDRLAADIKAATAGVQTWCEANRAEITSGNKVKFANLVTGEVGWRQRPPSVAIKGVEAVLKTLKLLGLQRYIRSKDEVDKEAILAAHSAAAAAPTTDPARADLVAEAERVTSVAGIQVVTGVEDFWVQPAAIELEAQS